MLTTGPALKVTIHASGCSLDVQVMMRVDAIFPALNELISDGVIQAQSTTNLKVATRKTELP
jgi:hypothetical protein